MRQETGYLAPLRQQTANALEWPLSCIELVQRCTDLIDELQREAMRGASCLSGSERYTAAGYLVLNGFESQVLTPMVLGRTMRINPLAIILWLMVWGWLWGVAGLLVAVPMLVCLKIVASRVEAWNRWSLLLE